MFTGKQFLLKLNLYKSRAFLWNGSDFFIQIRLTNLCWVQVRTNMPTMKCIIFVPLNKINKKSWGKRPPKSNVELRRMISPLAASEFASLSFCAIRHGMKWKLEGGVLYGRNMGTESCENYSPGILWSLWGPSQSSGPISDLSRLNEL